MSKLFSVTTNTAPPIVLTLTRNGVVIDLTTVTNVDLSMSLNGTITNTGHTSCSINSPASAGIVTYTPQASDFASAGLLNCEVKLTYSGGTIERLYQTFQIQVRAKLN